MPITYVAHANTPEELRQELVVFFARIHDSHLAKVQVPNQSKSTRQAWIVRTTLFGEVVNLLRGLSIEPKEASNAKSN